MKTIGLLFASMTVLQGQVPPQPAPQIDLNIQVDAIREQAQVFAAQAREQLSESLGQLKTEQFLAQVIVPPAPPAPPKPGVFNRGYGAGYGSAGEDGQYQRGQTALENRRWEEALQSFTQVASKGGTRADGAYYWKAYALLKLNRRDDAQSAIADLRKNHPQSRWLDDARALELQIRQAAGQSVSPESESDEDLKLLALNGLMRSDVDRAIPSVESLLKSGSPKLKRNALFVLAQSDSQRAGQLLEQTARGGSNPDLQMLAIRYYAQQKRNQAKGGQLLWEVYSASTDVNVQREALSAMSTVRDKDHLAQIAKGDRSSDNRTSAIRYLASNKDAGDTLAQIYAGESDAKIKQEIINTLSGQRDAKSLVALAKSERDAKLKTEIVRHLSNMKTPDAADYLMELLK